MWKHQKQRTKIKEINNKIKFGFFVKVKGGKKKLIKTENQIWNEKIVDFIFWLYHPALLSYANPDEMKWSHRLVSQRAAVVEMASHSLPSLTERRWTGNKSQHFSPF